MSFVRRYPTHERIQETYKILYQVFEGKTLGQSDAANRLEPIFMSALSSPFFELREKFFAMFAEPTAGGSLYHCLNYCFSERFQRWETSRGVFWVRHCLDVILSGASRGTQICPSLSVHRLPPLIPVAPSASMQSQYKSVPESLSRKDAMERVIARLTGHESWLREIRDITTNSIIEPLRTLCFLNQDLAYV